MWARSVFSLIIRSLGLGISVSLLAACSVQEVTTTSRVSPVFQAGPAEKTLCSSITSYSSPVTISLTATYQKRIMTSTGLGNAGAAQPIRYAEVEVTNSGGTTIQCGETNSSGQVSLQIPSSTSAHTVRIYSRANNSSAIASVLDAPENNNLYYIEASFTPDSSKSVSANAPVTGDILGGAFNILDQIVNANDLLRSKVSGFTVAPKVSAYWTKGFNPNSYFGSSQSGVSFYLPGFSRLFILGGIGGDTTSEDTDHFDDSVILHEYGHFLEDIFSITDSPGGSHSGNSMIDPRLAWSEGWGNFFQGAVRNSPDYIDSFGIRTSAGGSGGGLFFDIPLEAPEIGCSSFESGCDKPERAYEGNFREFAVTRFLWDVFDTGGDDSVDDEFAELWSLMTSTNAFRNPAEEFRNAGLLVEKYQDDISATGWDSLIADPTLRLNDTGEYATYVDNAGSCSPYTMNPVWDPTEDSGSFSTSDLLANNDFFFYKHSGGTMNLVLDYNTISPANDETDLDLYIYNSSARYGNASDIVGSAQEYFDNNSNTPETESISKNLPAGDYLINVKVYTGSYTPSGCIGSICQGNRIPAGDPLNFTLQVNGVALCPATRP